MNQDCFEEVCRHLDVPSILAFASINTQHRSYAQQSRFLITEPVRACAVPDLLRKIPWLDGRCSFRQSVIGLSYPVNQLAWSTNEGQNLLSSISPHSVHVLDMNPASTQFTFPVHEVQINEVDSIAWSPDGSQLAIGSFGSTLSIWQTSNPLFHLSHYAKKYLCQGSRCVAWSPDGQRIATGSWNHSIILWEQNATPLKTWKQSYEFSLDWSCECLTWSPDSRRLVSGHAYGGRLCLWDVSPMHEPLLLHTVYHVERGVFALSWHPQRNCIVSCCGDRYLRLWVVVETGNNQPSMQLHQTVVEHTNSIVCVKWSPDGKKLVSGSWDKTARVYALTNEKTLALLDVLQGHSDVITAVEWNATGTQIVTGSRDCTIRVWQV